MTLKTKNIPIQRWWDGWIALFALAAVTTVAARLWATEWTSDLYVLVYITVIAGAAGLALGYSRFSPWVAALFSAAYGAFTISWLFGTTVEMEMTWYDRIFNYLGWRLQIAIQTFNAGKAVADPLLFLMIMAVLLWLLASTTAFILIRKGAIWPVLIPLGVALLVIGQFDQDLGRNTRFLMSFLFFAFLLAGRMTFLRNRRQWRAEGINTTRETQLDFARTLVVLVAVLLILAWAIPVTTPQVRRYSELWDRVSEPFDRLSDDLSTLFVADNPSTTLSSSFFGDSLELGTGAPVNEDVVLTVSPIGEEAPGFRNYWRARAYDYYTNASWSTSPALPDEVLFPDDFSIPYPDWKASQVVTYTFTSQMDRMINIYTTGVPIGVDRPVEAVTQAVSETERDLIALIAEPNLRNGETYQVETRVNVPTIRELRESSTRYPDWLGRYLQLPSDFSPEIQALAAEITAGLDNPYDKAHAVTTYLRDHIEYSRALPPVPVGADPLEWFLFEEQLGFCNYYASAEILMLRSLGIPARLAVGYAEGEYDSETNTYTVQKQDSHAWPEVYFSGYGWVIFEPTVSQRAVVLPSGAAETGIAPTPSTTELDPLNGLPSTEPEIPEGILLDDDVQLAPETTLPAADSERVEGKAVVWTIIILFLVILLTFLYFFMRPERMKHRATPLPVIVERVLEQREKKVPAWLRRWSRLAQMSVPEKAYLQFARAIKILGEKPNPAQTPAERARSLTQLLPEARSLVQDILNEYHLDQFSEHIVNEDRARDAARKLRRLAIRTRFERFFQSGIAEDKPSP